MVPVATAFGRPIARLATPTEGRLELFLQKWFDERAHLAADGIFQRVEPAPRPASGGVGGDGVA